MIYLVSDGSKLKIGRSDTPQIRLRQLQTGNGRKLKIVRLWNIPDFYEKRLHLMFSRWRIVGTEWFSFGNIEEAIAIIDSIVNNDNT